jgi:hypothetical protein
VVGGGVVGGGVVGGFDAGGFEVGGELRVVLDICASTPLAEIKVTPVISMVRPIAPTAPAAPLRMSLDR